MRQSERSDSFNVGFAFELGMCYSIRYTAERTQRQSQLRQKRRNPTSLSSSPSSDPPTPRKNWLKTALLSFSLTLKKILKTLRKSLLTFRNYFFPSRNNLPLKLYLFILSIRLTLLFSLSLILFRNLRPYLAFLGFATKVNNAVVDVSFTTFLKSLEGGTSKITKTVIMPSSGTGKVIAGIRSGPDKIKIISTVMPPQTLPILYDRILKNNVKLITPGPTGLEKLSKSLFTLIPIGYCLLVYQMFKKMNPNQTSTPPNSYIKSTGVTFDDVVGQDTAKLEIKEVLQIFQNPTAYENNGVKPIKGALLVGPPGTGKTLLAKAIAGEARIPFYGVSGSEFIEVYVGKGAQRVRALFSEASKTGGIVFIDELDAVGRRRGLGGRDEQEQTLNQILTCLDGLSQRNVLIVAATNRYDVLDEALVRPGRFDRVVRVELPTEEGRKELLKKKCERFEYNVDLGKIAKRMEGASGAEIEGVVNEAAVRKVRRGGRTVGEEDFKEAVDSFYGSRKRSFLGGFLN
ncbi:hypothetical protein TL16_g03602 [Triparma laevis f. inornata]|uniref:AAA+ ATPase domain-containing protein n=2 Tax=Triparma laevis TaxID=1534972 RepID=A0A9W7FFU3_9STRA|nr:hypothetical protein TL16_g03602 [Triparma laevis f. inornata]GMI11341.1 hypothetical protein TrLO_g7771 [Triparma laevis f. longispina]